MTTIITPLLKSSELICRARGAQPSGVPAEQPGVCALCGCTINPGDLRAPLALGDGFMDDLYLAARGSQVICGWCPPSLTKEGLMQTGYGVFSASGHQPFRKWGDIAAALREPPKPPFTMVYATANNQHMAWRAPVNWSKDLFYVRVGLRDLKIRRQILLASIDDCALIADAIDRYSTKKSSPKTQVAKKTLPHPFANLSNDLKDIAHGRIKPAAFEVAAIEQPVKEALARLMDLTLGETWALRFLLTPGAGQDAAPAE